MRAAVLQEIGRVEIVDRPDPSPGPGDLVVEVGSVGICGSDMQLYRSGEVGGTPFVPGMIQGHEPSGIVVDVPRGVEGLRVGDRVAIEPAIPCGRCEPCRKGRYNICPNVRFLASPPCDGAFCHYLTRPAHTLYRLPDSLSLDDGAVVEPLAVAVHGARYGGVALGHHVAIVGVGAIGLLLLQTARCSGATRVYAFDRLDYRLELARRLGADECANVDQVDPVEALREWTRGRMCDRVFEAAGEAQAVAWSVRMASLGGTVILVGICHEDDVLIPITPARRGEVNILNLRRDAHAYPASIELVETGRVDVRSVVSHGFPLERAADAMAIASGYRDGAVKVMVQHRKE